MNARLTTAMTAFVQNNCDRSKMDVEWWAKENGCGVEEVRTAWEAAMTKHSTKPQNTYGEGK